MAQLAHTYDPILAVEEPSRWAFLGTLCVPDPGTVKVVHRVGRPLEVFTMHGGRLTGGELMWGKVRKLYTVDVSEHTLEWESRLPSEEDSFDFRAWMQVTCAVADPVAVVENGIRDTFKFIDPALTGTMQDVTRRFTLRERATAEGALIHELRQKELIDRFSAVFKLSSLVVQLRLHDTVVDVNQKRKLHREFYLPIVQSGEWGQLALLLTQDPSELNNVIDGLRQQDAQALGGQLAALELFMQGKDSDVEEHEYGPLRKKMLRSLFDGLNNAVASNPSFTPKRPAQLAASADTVDGKADGATRSDTDASSAASGSASPKGGDAP